MHAPGANEKLRHFGDFGDVAVVFWADGIFRLFEISVCMANS